MLTVSAGQVALTDSVTRSVDVEGNGVVDILDASTLAIAYGSSLGSPNYNGRADLDASGVVDLIDAATLALYFGATDLI